MPKPSAVEKQLKAFSEKLFHNPQSRFCDEVTKIACRLFGARRNDGAGWNAAAHLAVLRLVI
jgi:hypothetical protein